MAISPATPNRSSSSSSSSSSQPLLPATQQQLHTSLESQPLTPHHQDQRNTCPTLPLFISGDSNTTPDQDQDQDQDTNSHGRRIVTFDLNNPSSEPNVGGQDNSPSSELNVGCEDNNSPSIELNVGGQDNSSPPSVGGQANIPERIRLTNLKQLARAELENPVQMKKLKNEPEDDSAGPEENLDDSSQQQLDVACQSDSSSTVRRRNRYPGKNGRTCHQCHQKTLGFVASCNSGTECRKSYCARCIMNRYGEMVEVAHPLNDWICPCCREICNCSRCMKGKGLPPIGIRGRAGKTARFPSVMERVAANSSKNINRVVDGKETSATEEGVPGSDGSKDAGSSNSMEVHLSSEVNPRVGVGEEKSEGVGGAVKNISDVVKTISSRNDVLSVLLSPSRVDYESLFQPSDSV